MYALSANLTAALITNHKVALRADVLDNGLLVDTLEITGGEVSVDGTAAIRRTCTVTLTDPDGDLTPDAATDLLAPYGNELKLYRGATISGTDDTVPLGVFGIETCNVTGTRGDLQITLTGMDRSRKVQRARWTSAYSVASGTDYATAIHDMLTSRASGFSFNFTATTSTTTALVFGDSSSNDPWADAQKLAGAIGCELFFDADGVCVLRVVPDPSTAATAWTYAEGSTATILSVSRSMTRDGVYNHVIAAGEPLNGTAPVRAESYDDDPASPTYYLGDFGDVPYFFTSPLITTTAQAQSAADGLLRKVLGSSETVELDLIPNPAHEATDVIQVTHTATLTNSRYILDRFSIPLTYGDSMKASARRRTVLA